MRRALTAVAGVALTVVILAVPADAAKGKTQITAVKGTVTGQQYVVATCGWMPTDQGPMQYWATSISVDRAVISGSGIGKGTMSWTAQANPFMGMGGQPTTWVINASSSGSSVTGQSNMNLGMGGGGNQTISYGFGVMSGTGKFAGVTNGSLQTMQAPFNSPTCDPGFNPPANWDPNDQSTWQTGASSGAVPFSFTIYGQLIY
ncbi:MAG TPA: hypothetical protein VFC09_13990 [Candidatus Dormibacteraeota bacterium]|nr:hypothetical protein [Candidatus Dormibacteraeota bacterium]